MPTTARRRSPASCCFPGCATRRRLCLARIAISAGDSQTPCAATVRGPQKPSDSRYRVGDGLVSGFGRLAPRRRFPARWIRTGTCVRSASARAAFSVAASSVYIECGATAGAIRSSPANSLMNASVRARPSCRGLRVGDGKLDDRLAQHAAQARLSRHPRDLLLEVIHVGVGRRPGLDHLERREPRAGADELGRDGLCFGREDVFLQPVHQRQIVGEAAIQHHRRVRVRVDEAWHDHLARRRRSSSGRENCAAIAAGVSTADDVPAVDGDRPGRQAPGAAASIVTTIPPVRIERDGLRAAPVRRTQRRAATQTGKNDAAATSDRSNSISRCSLVALFHCVRRFCIVNCVRSTSSRTRSSTTRSPRCAIASTPPELFRRMAVRISLLLAAEATRDVPAIGRHGRDAARTGRRAPDHARRRRRAGAPRRTGHARRDSGTDSRRRASGTSACSATR